MKSEAFNRWLKMAKEVSPDVSILPCPLHANKNHHLQVGLLDANALLIRCSRGCNTREVLSALAVKTYNLVISEEGHVGCQCSGAVEPIADLVMILQGQVGWMSRVDLASRAVSSPMLKGIVDYCETLPFAQHDSAFPKSPPEDVRLDGFRNTMTLHI